LKPGTRLTFAAHALAPGLMLEAEVIAPEGEVGARLRFVGLEADAARTLSEVLRRKHAALPQVA
jgi:hypothetical protein